MRVPKHAIVKFNGGRGALLCNKCNHIIREDFDPMTIEDREYICERCEFNANWVVRGLTRRCPKGMEYDLCPYNPLLGCDCGVHKPKKVT